jgi:N-acetylmuramoyl-L-alanine amidase
MSLELIVKADTPLPANLHPSPNIEPRSNGARPTILLMHYTGMSTAAKALDWLARPESKVSCHYVVDIDGAITQMVAEDKRAWHAGVSYWQGETDINSASIGIEIQNPGHEHGYPAFAKAQMLAVAALSRDICQRHGIAPHRVLAHSDVAPARKIDPGEQFDWAWLAREGVGHWVDPVPVNPRDPGIGIGHTGPLLTAVQDLLALYGYDVKVTAEYDPKTEFALKAFQRHFRPGRVDGRIDQSTITTLERLLAKLPAPLVG